MDKIKDYRIEVADTNHELLDKIISAIKQGWIPIGGVSVASKSGEGGIILNTYIQALVKGKVKKHKK